MTASWHLGAGHRRLLLVGADHLARGPRLHVLHDHRPEDDSARHGRRGASTPSAIGLLVDAADRAADDRVRREGRAARLAHARLRGAAAARMAARRRTGGRGALPRASEAGGRGVAGVVGAAAFAGLLVLAGIPARPSAASAAQLAEHRRAAAGDDPATRRASPRSSTSGRRSQIAGDLIADLRTRSDALRLRDADHASTAVSGAVLADVRRQIRVGARRRDRRAELLASTGSALKLRAGSRSGAADDPRDRRRASTQRTVYAGSPPTPRRSARIPVRFTGTFELGQGGPGLRDPQRARRRPRARSARQLSTARRDREARRRAAAQRRAAGRAELPPGLVPLRDVDATYERDDGRRALLARLQQRRLAGPLRRQLVLRRRHREVGGARRPAAERAVRERAREVRQRQPRRRTPTSP